MNDLRFGFYFPQTDHVHDDLPKREELELLDFDFV